MKQFWHEFCLQAYMNRFQLWAMTAVIVAWLVIAEWVLSPEIRDMIVYACFGWFVLGAVLVPWVERKLEKLFN